MNGTDKKYRSIGVPLGFGSALHFIYIKEHCEKGKEYNKPSKTLFIGNVDYGLLSKNASINGFLTDIFKHFGTIQSIELSKYSSNIQDENADDFDFPPELAFDELDGHLDSSYFDGSRDKARFAHLTFMKKSELRGALSASDSVYYDIAKEVSKKWGVGDACKVKSSKVRLHFSS